MPLRTPPPRVKDWQAVTLLGVAVAVFFNGILTQRTFLWDDVLAQTYPFRAFAATSLANHELPLWNPYVFGGMPFQADIQSAILYLPNLALTLFVSGGHLSYYALEVMILAHFWLAGVAMYFLAKELGLEAIFALFSGLVFSLSGFMIVHAVHPVFVEEAAWLPFIVLLFHRALRRRSLAYAAGAGLAFGHAVLAGAPQISLYIGFFLGLFFLFLFAVEARTNSLRSALGTVPIVGVTFAIAVGVAAVQLLPTFELIPLSDRATFSFATAQQYRLSWVQMLSAIVPKFLGAEGPRESTFWASGDYGAYWETCFYLGIPGLLAILASLRSIRTNRYAAFCAVVVLLSLLLAVGDHFFLNGLFFRFVPGFSRFRGPARILLFLTLCGALLAGFGMRAGVYPERSEGSDPERNEGPRRLEWTILAAFGAIALVCVLVWMGVFVPKVPEPVHGRVLAYVREKADWAFGFTVAAAGTALLLARRLIGPAVAVALVMLIQFGDVLEFGYDQNNGPVSADQYYLKARARIAPLLAANDRELFRVVTRSGRWVMVDRNEGMVDRVFQLEGYTPLALQRRLPPAPDVSRSYDLLNAKYRVVVDTQAGRMWFAAFPSYLPRAYLVHEARVMDSAAVESFMRTGGFDPRRMVVVEEPLSLSTAGAPALSSDTVSISRYRLNSIDVDVRTPQPAVLVLSEIFYPGWRAYIDGTATRVLRADWNLRAVPVPPGSHRVEVRFEPSTLRRGAALSLITLLSALGMIVWPFVRERRQRTVAAE
jgi:hypothetical protein